MEGLELIRRRAMMVKSKPYDAEIEYLEGVQGAYIKTGFVVNSSNWSNLRLEFVGSFAGSAVSEWRAFGVGYSNISYYIGNNLAHKIAYGRGDAQDNTLPRTLTLSEYTTRHTYIYDYKNGVISFDSERYNFTPLPSSSINQEFYLYTWNSGTWQATYMIGGKLYEFRIYNNDVLVMDMRPVRIGQVGYLYDKVSKQLFGNAGAGSFILGDDI